MSGLSMSLVIRSVAGGSFSDEAVCWAGAGVPPRRGRSHLFTQKVPQHYICGPAGRSAGEGLGRPAVVPPAGKGRGVGCAPLSGRWGEGGALSSKAPEWVRTERTRYLTGGGRPRGPRRRVATVGRVGVSLSIPRADGLGKKWTERTRSLPGGGRPSPVRQRLFSPGEE